MSSTTWNQILFESENNIPIGYKFHPTPSEAILMFLLPRITGTHSPSDHILDLDDVFQFDPDDLPSVESEYVRDDERYVFTPEERRLHGRMTQSGCWKVEDEKENMPINRRGEVIGFKSRLSFFSHDEKTDWKMTEYRLNVSNQNNLVRYMLCKIRRKPKRRITKKNVSVPEE